MIFLGIVLGGIAAIIIMVVLFSVYSKSKKLKQLLIRDVNKLKYGSVNHVYTEDAELNQEIKKQILNYYTSIDAKVVEGLNQEIIAYVNKFNKAFLGGIFDLDPLKFPVRIIITPKGSKTEIRMDDSYGFQKFKGNAKAVFEQKNKEAFQFYHTNLTNFLNAKH